MWGRQRDDGVEHVFTHADRKAQLADLERSCSRMAALLEEHDEPRSAGVYRVRAQNAALLLAEGFAKADLNELAGQFPDEPWWLNPKAEAPHAPWQAEVARLHAHATIVAMDLRAVAVMRRD